MAKSKIRGLVGDRGNALSDQRDPLRGSVLNHENWDSTCCMYSKLRRAMYSHPGL